MQRYVLNKNGGERSTVLANAHAFIDRLPDTKSWVIEVKALVKTRSNPQNNALFGVAYAALTDATGFTKDELHEAFCKRFFGTAERNVFGQIKLVPYRTTTMDCYGQEDVISPTEFAKFYDMVQMVGAEAGCDVPSPQKEFRP